MNASDRLDHRNRGAQWVAIAIDGLIVKAVLVDRPTNHVESSRMHGRPRQLTENC